MSVLNLGQKRSTGLIFVYLYFFSLTAFGQPHSTKIIFNKISKDLSNNDVTSIAQDHSGFLWVGTKEGLNKFDGESFKVYNQTYEENSLPNSNVGSLLVQEDNTLWVGTFNGLCYYNREKDSFIRVSLQGTNYDPVNLERHDIRSIEEDDNGTVWVANEREGVFYKKRNTENFVQFEIPGLKRPTALLLDQDSILWIGTYRNGLIRFDLNTKQFQKFTPDPEEAQSISISYVQDLALDKNGDLFISGELGLDKLTKGGNKFRHYGSKRYNYGEMLNDSQGRFWVCVQNGGVLMYNEAQDDFYKFENDPLDPQNNLSFSYWSIHEDHEHRIWLGSTIGGLTVVDQGLNRFDYYHSNVCLVQSLSDNVIHEFYEDEKENLWIATDGGGLDYFDRSSRSYEHYRYDPNDDNSLSANAVMTLSPVRPDELWVGTWMGGLNILDLKTRKFRPFQPDNPDLYKVLYILKAKNNKVWIGTGGSGVLQYDLLTKKTVTFKSDAYDSLTLSNNDVHVVFEDSQENIWVGTWAAGLSLLKKNQIQDGVFTRFLHSTVDSTSLAGNKVNHVFEDSRKNIWIATVTGLSLYDASREAFKNFTIDNGLASNNIFAIAEDDQGFLWISTSLGLSKFDPVNETFDNFSQEDGLQPGTFSRHSVLKTKKGELVFGGTEGFNIFHPDEIFINRHKPNVYITGLKIFNQPVEIGDESSILSKDIASMDQLTLSYQHSVFTLDFIALNFTIPEKNSYAYKLEGFDEKWNFIGNKKSATYTNLDPGKYLFRVKAANNDGVWNEEGAVLKINIESAWWMSWWAISIWVLIFIGTVLFVMAFLISKRQKKELSKLVEIRTAELTRKNDELKAYDHMVSHDLKSPISNISMLGQMLSDDENLKLSDSNKEVLSHIVETSNTSLKLINDILAFAASDKPEDMEVNVDLQLEMDKVLEAFAMKIKSLNGEVKLHDLPTIDKGVPIKIYQLFYNLIGNALKFVAPDRPPKITVYMQNDQQLVVEDNGIGFDQKDADEIFKPLKRLYNKQNYQGHGIGLGTCKRVADFHGWKIHAESEIGKGTKFIITLKS